MATRVRRTPKKVHASKATISSSVTAKRKELFDRIDELTKERYAVRNQIDKLAEKDEKLKKQIESISNRIDLMDRRSENLEYGERYVRHFYREINEDRRKRNFAKYGKY